MAANGITITEIFRELKGKVLDYHFEIMNAYHDELEQPEILRKDEGIEWLEDEIKKVEELINLLNEYKYGQE